MSRILLLEDDDSLGATLRERLEKEGYGVAWAKSLKDARAALEKSTFDVAILDLGLPDGSGFEFALEARGKKGIPFLFLTAMATAEYRLQGYELGAEEFIPKPFHLKELLLRVGHVLENHAKRKNIRVGGKTVDFARMAVTSEAGVAPVYLAAKDCQVLRLLADSAPDVVSRDRMLEIVWGEESFPTNRTVDNSIVRIRAALGDESARHIRTVRGVGYQLIFDSEEKNDG